MIVELVVSHLAVMALPVIFLRRKIKQADQLREKTARQMQEALSENKKIAQTAENRILATLESMVEGVLITSADGRVILMNSALSEKINASTKNSSDVFYWEIIRDPEVNQMIGACLQEKKAMKMEHSILLSGAVFEIQISPVWNAGDFMGVIAVFHDVTRLKNLEKVRIEFAANVSHELKTPLTSILGYVETLKEGAAEDPSTRDQFLDVIENHAKRLHSLIEELLLLASVESKEELVRLEKINLEDLSGRTLRVFERVLAQKKITVKKEFSEKPFWVSVDAVLFERVLTNLIDNAVKYSGEGSEIVLSARTAQGRVEISVQDHGEGIAEEDLPRIFERFYRADKSRARESGGSGLGLAIVKHIIERHDGTIQVSSRLGEGSRFTITLPVLNPKKS